ncbi:MULTISPECIES: DUF3800 domain-containing protein [Protofrankia]|uniref:DUF3800 domain-containing protein n=1 Tax=Candidatus Protofrankia datiscae TaxID=2716812 RepID=F8B4X1_9ACTN|nr:MULTISPECIES: hypothetical protein [Protofrankia]AEH10095.1 hypothetical protein FsymDg_2758 [Candidatus Protofrankia datiscae]
MHVPHGKASSVGLLAAVDESYGSQGKQRQVYVLAAVLVPAAPELLARTREELGRLRLHGQRPHFGRDSDKRRRAVAETIRALELPTLVVVRTARGAEMAERSRGLCLARLSWELRDTVQELLIERREHSRNRHDRSVLAGLRGQGVALSVRFPASEDDPLLWAADAVASAVFQAEARGRSEYLALHGPITVHRA